MRARRPRSQTRSYRGSGPTIRESFPHLRPRNGGLWNGPERSRRPWTRARCPASMCSFANGRPEPEPMGVSTAVGRCAVAQGTCAFGCRAAAISPTCGRTFHPCCSTLAGCAGLLARCRRGRPGERAGRRPAPLWWERPLSKNSSCAPLRGGALDAGQKARAAHPEIRRRCTVSLYAVAGQRQAQGAALTDPVNLLFHASMARTVIGVLTLAARLLPRPRMQE